MRVLWFSITPSMFAPSTVSHNGGGWVASLEGIVRTLPEVELGIAFELGGYDFKYEDSGVTYYPLSTPKHPRWARFLGKRNETGETTAYLKVIEDFKPDLIQIFGSENNFGSICSLTDIPVLIHMQGSLPPYHNALFPVGMNSWDFLFCGGLCRHRRLMGLRSESSFRKKAEREINTIQSCRHFLGRTAWDKALVKLFNPQANYFHCEEALRPSFFHGEKLWHPPAPSDRKVRIASVISNPWYKGLDLILKTAKLLCRFTKLDVEWKVYGVSDIVPFFEKKYGIKAAAVGVHAMGAVSQEALVEALCSAHCFVAPSYIDNSPNSVCEAQLLGMPVLATNVGGVSSIVREGETGILFPANDPYMLASHITSLLEEPDRARSLGQAAREQALSRHNPESIGRNLLSIYRKVLKHA